MLGAMSLMMEAMFLLPFDPTVSVVVSTTAVVPDFSTTAIKVQDLNVGFQTHNVNPKTMFFEDIHLAVTDNRGGRNLTVAAGDLVPEFESKSKEFKTISFSLSNMTLPISHWDLENDNTTVVVFGVSELSFEFRGKVSYYDFLVWPNKASFETVCERVKVEFDKSMNKTASFGEFGSY
ncbi:hypothetical protein CsatB_002425 [Cannabis sativa]